jgi:hypothetical protein
MNLLSPILAHLLVESAVDLRVKSGLDGAIGPKMLLAATTRSPDTPWLRAAAYAEGLSAFSGLTLEEAQAYLVAVENANRRDIIRYGQAYSGSQGRALQFMAGLGVTVASAYLNAATYNQYNIVVPLELAVQLLLTADSVIAADYANELRATLVYLRAQMSGIDSTVAVTSSGLPLRSTSTGFTLPSSTWCASPRFSPSVSSVTARTWSPSSSKSLTSLKLSCTEGMAIGRDRHGRPEQRIVPQPAGPSRPPGV